MSKPLVPHDAFQVVARTATGHILILHGTTVPTDTTPGYATGCIFIHTDGAAATSLYVNQGSATSCLFVAIPSQPVGSTVASLSAVGGSQALDGSNPTAVVTGLSSILAFTATIQGAVAPADGTSVLTHDISGGTVNVYAWTNTGGTDPTLAASTGTETFDWIAIGSE